MAKVMTYRAEQVGSLLRPADVLAARAAFAEGRIELARLRACEDKAILDVLDMQRQVGIGVVLLVLDPAVGPGAELLEDRLAATRDLGQAGQLGRSVAAVPGDDRIQSRNHVQVRSAASPDCHRWPL